MIACYRTLMYYSSYWAIQNSWSFLLRIFWRWRDMSGILDLDFLILILHILLWRSRLRWAVALFAVVFDWAATIWEWLLVVVIIFSIFIALRLALVIYLIVTKTVVSFFLHSLLRFFVVILILNVHLGLSGNWYLLLNGAYLYLLALTRLTYFLGLVFHGSFCFFVFVWLVRDIGEAWGGNLMFWVENLFELKDSL